jgi:hypothetical protein
VEPVSLLGKQKLSGSAESKKARRRYWGSGKAEEDVMKDDEDADEELGGLDFGMDLEMDFGEAAITSKGNVSATFRVPGLVTIPCDGDTHNFTIVELSLSAALSSLSVPKLDAKTHLTVRFLTRRFYIMPKLMIIHAL